MPIVTSLACGIKNKLERYSVAQLPICGRCGAKLPEPGHRKILRSVKRNWAWLVLIGLGGGAWFADTIPTSKKHTSSSRTAYAPAAPTCAPVSISSGIYRVYTKHERIAPFRIVAPSGSNYYAKLVDSATKRDIMSMYVIGGRPLEVDVPLGSYRLKYAYGNVWCGESLLFGEHTAYSEAQSTFEFSVQGDRLSGYTVELIPQMHGNLRTKSIRASEL
jgi:hypothetical protein